MITLRRPTDAAVASYRRDRLSLEPSCAPAERPPDGFHHVRYHRMIGTTTADFRRARAGLQQWRSHRGSGVEVFPEDVGVAEGETVGIVTRQLGLWVLAACRITAVVDEEEVAFGFTYATLPDHPECGYESFVVRLEQQSVLFEVDAVSRAGIPLVRLGSPVTRRLQARAVEAYLSALEGWTRGT